MAERSFWISSHSRTSMGRTFQCSPSDISCRTRRARKVERANFEPPHDGILASSPGAGVTSTSSPVTPTSRHTRPAKTKVSPTSSTSR